MKKPFRIVPTVISWLETYNELRFRYKFLVMEGPSQMGKHSTAGASRPARTIFMKSIVREFLIQISRISIPVDISWCFSTRDQRPWCWSKRSCSRLLRVGWPVDLHPRTVTLTRCGCTEWDSSYPATDGVWNWEICQGRTRNGLSSILCMCMLTHRCGRMMLIFH